MTYPITPNISVHIPPATSVTGRYSNDAVNKQVQSLFAQLPMKIMIEIVNAILEGLGLGKYEGPIDGALTALSNAMSTVNEQNNVALGTFWSDVSTDISTYDASGFTFASFSTLMTSLDSDWNTYISAVASNDQTEISSIQTIINGLFNIDPSTGLLSQDRFPAWLNTLQTDLSNVGQDLLAMFGLTSTRTAADFNADVTTLINALLGTTTTAPSGTPTLSPSNVASPSGTSGSTLTQDFAAISEPFQTGSLFSPTAWSDAMTGLGNLLGIAPTELPATTAGTAKIAAAQIVNVLGGSDLGADVTTNQTTTGHVVDGIHQAINGDTSTGTPATLAAVKTNLLNIPAKNIGSTDYAVLTFTSSGFTIPANASIYIPPSLINTIATSGNSIQANTTDGLWVAKPGLYSIEVITYFKSTSGYSFTGSLTPSIVHNTTAPPSTGTWTGSNTTPAGTSATIVDPNVNYTIIANHIDVHTDAGNKYYMPGFYWSNSTSTAANVTALTQALTVAKISS